MDGIPLKSIRVLLEPEEELVKYQVNWENYLMVNNILVHWKKLYCNNYYY